MFDHIPLIPYHLNHALSSVTLKKEGFDEEKYDWENVSNAKYLIAGWVETFPKSPLTPYAKEHLNYLQGFTVFHYQAPSYTERENYHSYLIAYTYGGKATLSYRGKTYTLSQGDGFFIDCMEPHSYKALESAWDVATIHLQGPLLGEMHKYYMQGGSAVFHDPIVGEFQEKLEQMLAIYSSPQVAREWQASSAIESLVTYLLVLSQRPHSGKVEAPQSIRELIQYMELNFRSQISLDSLAEMANMNKHYLIRMFKKYTGFTPANYMISLRIAAAKQLLLTTSLPASKIAYEVGIHDLNNFNNLFKRYVGMTPIQYRKTPDFLV